MLTPLEQALSQVTLALLVAAAAQLGPRPLDMQQFLDAYEAQLAKPLSDPSMPPPSVAEMLRIDAMVREQIRKVVEERAGEGQESS